MSRDLVFDSDGKPYAKAHLSPEQQAAQDRKNAIYWAWTDAKMARTFKGSLEEYKAAQKPLAEHAVKQLKVMARELKIRGRSALRKAALVVAIETVGWPPAPGPLLALMLGEAP